MEKTTKTNLTFNFLDCIHYSTEKVETNRHSDDEIELTKRDIVGIVDIERNVSVAIHTKVVKQGSTVHFLQKPVLP